MGTAEHNTALLQAINGILAQWTAPDFITAVAAREGVVLDPSALALLSIVNTAGAQRPSMLAERMATGASNISKITARLQQIGFVKSSVDPIDSRATLIVLTAAGQRAGEALQRSGSVLINELLHDWSAEDRRDLARLLVRFEVESTRVATRLAAAESSAGPSSTGAIDPDAT